MTSTSPAPSAATGAQAAPTLRGRTQRMVGLRKIIAQRMVESLRGLRPADQRGRGRPDRDCRTPEPDEGGLRGARGRQAVVPSLPREGGAGGPAGAPESRASIDSHGVEITYHDAEHLGVAVDTERGCSSRSSATRAR